MQVVRTFQNYTSIQGKAAEEASCEIIDKKPPKKQCKGMTSAAKAEMESSVPVSVAGQVSPRQKKSNVSEKSMDSESDRWVCQDYM